MQMFSYFQENRATSCVVVTWEDKCLNPAWCLFLLLSLSFHCWAWCRVVWIDPLVRWGQLSRLCHLQVLVHLQTPCLRGGVRKTKEFPWSCISTVQQQLKQWCVVDAVSIIDQKHSNTWASMQKNPGQSQYNLHASVPTVYTVSNTSSLDVSLLHILWYIHWHNLLNLWAISVKCP